MLVHHLKQLLLRKRACLVPKAGLDRPLRKMPVMSATVAEVAVKHAMYHAKLYLQTPTSSATERPAAYPIWAWPLRSHHLLHQSAPAMTDKSWTLILAPGSPVQLLKPSILLHGLAMNTTMALERLTYLKKVAVELPPANCHVEVSI